MQAIEVHARTEAGTVKAGVLHIHGHPGTESSTFSYSGEWLAHADSFAFQPDLPLKPEPVHVGRERNSLPGFVRDASPDRWGRKLVKLRAARNGMQGTSGECRFLLSLADSSRIGALSYRIDGSGPFLGDIGSRPEPRLSDIGRIAQSVAAVQEGSETEDDLAFLLDAGSPLGGARPKCAVIDSDGHAAIAKFAKPDDVYPIAVGEALCSSLAALSGIDAAEARLVRAAGQHACVVRRFDRSSDGGRVHFVSALTVLGLLEGQDATYTDIAASIRSLCADPAADMRQLFRRAVFNVLVSNVDDHLRNHGFLHEIGKGWRLAPAFDMNPVPQTGRRPRLSTWISEAGPEAAISYAIEAAGEFGLSDSEALAIVTEEAAVAASWRQVGRRLGIGEADLSALETAFEHAEAAEAAKLGQRGHRGTAAAAL